MGWTKYQFAGDAAYKRTPLFGLYEVESFVKNGDTLAPAAGDSARWKIVNILIAKKATIEMMDKSTRDFTFIADTLRKNIQIGYKSKKGENSTLHYTQPDKNHLLLSGRLQEDSVHILLKKQDLNQFNLMNRGFHWITETPYKK